MIKKIISVLLAINLLSSFALALELDTSIDDEIRRNYNPSKLELESLPPLPKTNTSPSSSNMPLPPKTLPSTPSSKPSVGVKNLPNYSGSTAATAIRIKKGTKFRVKSTSVISDYLKEGTSVSFKSVKPVTQTYITVPEGTVFKGIILDSHQPQIAGNGGLVVLIVDSMVFRGSTISVHAKITKANHKKIFINNIKGQRGYLKGVVNSMQPGKRFYHKMIRATASLSDGPFTILLTPFTVAAGVVVYGVNIVGSPVFAIFAKGKRISIPAGCEFEVKLLEDIDIY